MAFNLLADKLCVNDPEEHIHISRKMLKLFKVAGKVRDLQVQLDFFHQLHGAKRPEFKRFTNWLQKWQDKKIAKFSSSPHAYIHHSIPPHFHEAIRQTLAKADTEHVIQSLTEVMQEIQTYIDNFNELEPNPKNLHTLRKKAKQLRYLIAISSDVVPTSNVVWHDVETLRQIEGVAGKWHDRVVSCKMLSSYIENHTRTKSRSRKNLENLLLDVEKAADFEFVNSIEFLKSQSKNKV
jgi:CHAD domain-containing protein